MHNPFKTPSSSCTDVAVLLVQERLSLLESWRCAVGRLPCTRNLSAVALNDHIPELLNELGKALVDESTYKSSSKIKIIGAAEHALQRLHQGFAIEEVISEYSALRTCIHEFADKHSLVLKGTALQTINLFLDSAVYTAVHAYVRQSTDQVRQRREDYLAFVAHDLRTPLNCISLATDIFEHYKCDSTCEHIIENVVVCLRHNVELMSVLVEEIVKENINVESFMGIYVDARLMSLGLLVQEVIDSMHLVAVDANTMLVNEIAESFTIVADRRLLRRVFQNLIANAVRFTSNGMIRITASINKQGTEAVCEVVDTGSGIPEDRIEAVFEKLESNSVEIGRGLGLALTKLFVEAHGGMVSAHSETGVGSNFRFTLPFIRVKQEAHK